MANAVVGCGRSQDLRVRKRRGGERWKEARGSDSREVTGPNTTDRSTSRRGREERHATVIYSSSYLFHRSNGLQSSPHDGSGRSAAAAQAAHVCALPHMAAYECIAEQ